MRAWILSSALFLLAAAPQDDPAEAAHRKCRGLVGDIPGIYGVSLVNLNGKCHIRILFRDDDAREDAALKVGSEEDFEGVPLRWKWFVQRKITRPEAEDDRMIREIVSCLARTSSLDRVERRLACEEAAGRWKDREGVLWFFAREGGADADAAWICLAHLGDKAVSRPLQDLVATTGHELRLPALAALGRIPSSSAPEGLSDLLREKDLRAVFAAARLLSRIPVARARRLMEKEKERAERAGEAGIPILLAYASHLAGVRRKENLAALIGGLRSGHAGAFRYALIALENLPDGLESLGANREELDQDGLRDRLRTAEMEGAERKILGRILMKLGVVTFQHLMDDAKSPPAGWEDWAPEAPYAMVPFYRYRFLEEICRQMEAREGDEEAASRLEAVFRKLAGMRPGEGAWAGRVEDCRKWLDVRAEAAFQSEVNVAVDAGVAFLRGHRTENGTWRYQAQGRGIFSAFDTGVTALVVYALLKCGVAPDDPVLLKGLDHLLKAEIWELNYVYTNSSIAMALAEFLQQEEEQRRLRRSTSGESAKARAARGQLEKVVRWLVDSQQSIRHGGYDHGPWTYRGATRKTGTREDFPRRLGRAWDNSNTQFATLGLAAAHNAKVDIPRKAWEKAARHWSACFSSNGTWPYSGSYERPMGGTTSMTAAGMGCHLLCQAALKKKAPDDLAPDDEKVEAARKYLARTYPIPGKGGRWQGGGWGGMHTYYMLYSLERAMMLAGVKKLGGRDWYRDGAKYLISVQKADGSWGDDLNTAFALLFLKKAYITVATGGPRADEDNPPPVENGETAEEGPPKEEDPVEPKEEKDPLPAEFRAKLMSYSGVRTVRMEEGKVVVTVESEEDARDLRMLLGPRFEGLPLDIVVGD